MHRSLPALRPTITMWTYCSSRSWQLVSSLFFSAVAAAIWASPSSSRCSMSWSSSSNSSLRFTSRSRAYHSATLGNSTALLTDAYLINGTSRVADWMWQLHRNFCALNSQVECWHCLLLNGVFTVSKNWSHFSYLISLLPYCNSAFLWIRKSNNNHSTIKETRTSVMYFCRYYQ